MESTDWDPSVTATSHMGKEWPATKKFSALPLTKKYVMAPTMKERATVANTARAYPAVVVVVVVRGAWYVYVNQKERSEKV